MRCLGCSFSKLDIWWCMPLWRYLHQKDVNLHSEHVPLAKSLVLLSQGTACNGQTYIYRVRRTPNHSVSVMKDTNMAFEDARKKWDGQIHEKGSENLRQAGFVADILRVWLLWSGYPNNMDKGCCLLTRGTGVFPMLQWPDHALYPQYWLHVNIEIIAYCCFNVFLPTRNTSNRFLLIYCHSSIKMVEENVHILQSGRARTTDFFIFFLVYVTVLLYACVCVLKVPMCLVSSCASLWMYSAACVRLHAHKQKHGTSQRNATV